MPNNSLLIAGAGPTGLFLAIYLRTVAPTIPITIIDKATGPGTTSRAMVVQARTVEYYRQLNLADTLLAQAQTLTSTAITTNGKERCRVTYGGVGAELTKYPVVLSFPQDRNERLLLRRLQELGVTVLWDTALEDLTQHDGHVTATFAGKPHDFTYLAACDGAHSSVRHPLGLKMHGGTYPQRTCVADVVVKHISSPTQLSICPTAQNFALFIPYDNGGSVRIFRMLNSADYATKSADEVTFADLRPSIEASTGLQIEAVNWSSVYQAHHLQCSRFRERRVFVLGDAAHLHSPAGGQGMNTGLGDAANLAWKLGAVVAGRASEEVLGTYAPEREAFARLLIRSTDRAFTLMSQVSVLGWFVRCVFLPFVLPLLWRVPVFAMVFFRTVSQLRVEYCSSPLSQGCKGKVRAGMRMPWVEYGERDNFEKMTPPHWQLHVYGQVGNTHEDLREWKGWPVYEFELTSMARSAGLAEKTWYFVRPDGHIGLVCGMGHEKVLEEYVARWGFVPERRKS